MSELTIDKIRNYTVPSGGMSIKDQHYSTNFIVTFLLLHYDQLRTDLASAEKVLEAARRCERQDTTTRDEDESTTPEEFEANLVEGASSWNNLIITISNHDKGRK